MSRRSATEPDAGEQFKKVAEAYEVLNGALSQVSVAPISAATAESELT